MFLEFAQAKIIFRKVLSMADVLALILAGGRVDDLGVLTFFRPKSMMPFGGVYRVIDFPMSNLIHSGIEKVGILSQYRPFHLLEHISNGAPWDMKGRNRFVVVLTPFKGHETADWYQGTADAVYQNLDFLRLHKPELLLILSGDHVYNMDYREIIAYHREKKADLTIAFTKVKKEGAHRFGLADIDDEDKKGGRVLQYIEKPEKPPFEWASLTIYVFNPDILIEALEENAKEDSHEFGKDIIPKFLENRKVYGYKHRGYWGYTRTPLEYWHTNMDLLGKTPKLDINAWRVMTNLAHRGIYDRQTALTGISAKIENSLFYSGCRIDGTVTNSILFPGVRVDEGAVVRNSILFFDTIVEKNAKINNTISDMEVVFKQGAEIGGKGPMEDLSVIGWGSLIPENVKIAHGVTVYPNLTDKDFKRNEYLPGDIIK